ncbi:beta-lactamase family protein [Streptomyces sp. 130]|uniref:serine hydrolase domain-containing protein n=1 Tax=Streptomyces sp. 130 TaxID=2591006 RepID=UPI00117BE34D|nr:serine hydrolase domain-containing protein [Streptomyces sp. 130]TRV80955.1 beta-lactamase family protein [Streptomyces sp. 130]
MSASEAPARIRRMLEQLVERRILLGGQVFHRHRGETHRFAVGQAVAGAGADEVAGRLYCANKPVLAVIAGLAAQDGLLGFQDPLARFFDDCAPAMAAVTVADLLGHTVRLPPSLHRDSPSLDERGRRIVASATPRQGPAHYNAQSTSAVLGAIVERVHARPLADVVEERVARPLGLRDLALVARPGRPYGALHRRDGHLRFVPVEDEARGLGELNPGQAGVSTAADAGLLYADLLASLGGRGTLLSQATARRLVAAGPPVQLYDLGERSWGLGFQRDLPKGILGAGWGPGTFGHLGTAPRRIVVVHAAEPEAGRVLTMRLFSPVDDRWVRQLTAVA